MTVVVWAAALVSAAVFVLVFVWESVLFTRPGVHKGIFAVESDDVPVVRLWAFGVGFYNLFLGVGAAAGVALWATSDPGAAQTVGRTLVVFTCACMLGSGLVLLVADRLAMGRERGAGLPGVAASTLPPLVALVAVAL